MVTSATEFAKTILEGTRAEIHFIPSYECYTHALSRNTKYLAMDGQVCFHRWLSYNTVSHCHTTRIYYQPIINSNPRGTSCRLLLMAFLAYCVDCVCQCHTLNTYHSFLSSSGWLNWPFGSPPAPTSYKYYP